MNPPNRPVVFKPFVGPTFKFRCHKGISCFTKCCADLVLVLTPYDIVRMKNRLNLSSDQFLERYTETRFDKRRRFPTVVLRMNQDEKRSCPFVAPSQGCTIYVDRPGACRIYPLGRATLKADDHKDTKERFFVINEDHCLGFREDKEWTLRDWIANEGINEYDRMNDQWLEIVTSQRTLGPRADIPRKIAMFCMASYNLDIFRRLILGSRFFDLFEVDPVRRDKLTYDDIELMKFAFDWLKFSLFGKKTIRIRSEMGGHQATP
jgi:Fe-S-cluster containining protein